MPFCSVNGFGPCSFYDGKLGKCTKTSIRSFASRGSESCETGKNYLGKSTAGAVLASETRCVKLRNMMTANRETSISFPIIFFEYNFYDHIL